MTDQEARQHIDRQMAEYRECGLTPKTSREMLNNCAAELARIEQGKKGLIDEALKIHLGWSVDGQNCSCGVKHLASTRSEIEAKWDAVVELWNKCEIAKEDEEYDGSDLTPDTIKMVLGCPRWHKTE